MYKIIASDLDQTLIQYDNTISAKNIEAIQQARQLGVRFIPATGRGYMTIQNTLKDLGLYDEVGEYSLSFNGGAITENKDNRLLYLKGISFEEASQLYQRGLDYQVGIHVYTEKEVYGIHLDEDEMRYLEGRMPITLIDESNIDFLKGQQIVKCLYVNTDYGYLRSIEDDLQDISGNLDVSYSSNRYIEFNRKGVTKGSGLKELARLLEVDIGDVIAIGDNFNDLTMIEAAGLGIGVANTIEGMKPYCDVILDSSCEESAIAEVVERYILNG